MVDLHMHTLYSDGSDTVLELLNKCNNLNLKYISITDHDSCKAHIEIFENKLYKNFNGIIIPGVEVTTTYKGRTIEILAYGVNYNKMQDWLSGKYPIELVNERIEYCKRTAIKNLEKYGIYIDINSLDSNYSYSRAIYMKLLENKNENEAKLGIGMLDDIKIFFRTGLANPNSPLFIDVEKYRPTPKEVTDIIHACGGKTFLAHPYQYAFNDTLEMINNLRNECDLDGVEVFHSSFNEDNMRELYEYAKRNKLLISGGSDYHGTVKPNISLMTGINNNLLIKAEYISWLD